MNNKTINYEEIRRAVERETTAVTVLTVFFLLVLFSYFSASPTEINSSLFRMKNETIFHFKGVRCLLLD